MADLCKGHEEEVFSKLQDLDHRPNPSHCEAFILGRFHLRSLFPKKAVRQFGKWTSLSTTVPELIIII